MTLLNPHYGKEENACPTDQRQSTGCRAVFVRDYYPQKTSWTEMGWPDYSFWKRIWRSLQDSGKRCYGQTRPRLTCIREMARRVWTQKGIAHTGPYEPTSSSVKHGDGGVVAWACMAATDTGTLIFIDEVTADGSCTMTSEVYRNTYLLKLR